MDASRRAFVQRVAMVGAGIAASGNALVQAATCDAAGASRHGAIFDEQPPAALTFTVGVPASVPYGKGHHPDGRALAAGLDALPAGFTITLAGDQIWLHWDGRGEAGVFHVRAFLDDGA